MQDYKIYKRFPIQIGSQTIMLIHLFSDSEHALDNAFEMQDMENSSDAVMSAMMNHNIHEEAAKQFFAQLEGHYSDSFLMELIKEATIQLHESDKSSNALALKVNDTSIQNRAIEALEEAKKAIQD